jgi:hypothetical protein
MLGVCKWMLSKLKQMKMVYELKHTTYEQVQITYEHEKLMEYLHQLHLHLHYSSLTIAT